ncbi:MAG: type II toxin-antitoxin system RelE family toxin [Actinomycetota bacterium]
MPEPLRYRLVLSPGARRALTESLNPAAALAAWEFVSGPLRDAPHRVGTALREPFAGLWRARRGEYRVIYEIDDDQRLVRVVDVDHRRDVYRG